MSELATKADIKRIEDLLLRVLEGNGAALQSDWVPLSVLRKRLGHRYPSSTNAHVKANPTVYVPGETIRVINGRTEVLLAEVEKRLATKNKRGPKSKTTA